MKITLRCTVRRVRKKGKVRGEGERERERMEEEKEVKQKRDEEKCGLGSRLSPLDLYGLKREEVNRERKGVERERKEEQESDFGFPKADRGTSPFTPPFQEKQWHENRIGEERL